MAFWKRGKAPAPAPTPPPSPPIAVSSDSLFVSSPYWMSPVELQAWLYTNFGRNEPPVRDVGWAWWIDAGTDVYLIIRSDRSVWRLPPDPTSQPLFAATDEADFHTVWRRTRGTEPFPDYWIPR